MDYRREIDGLRAVAVIPVILFHAGFTFFSGGFVGVDVFFVISGYLISTILITEIEEKRFSLSKFYERRARRILPALFFITIVFIPFAWVYMLPSQFIDYSEGLAAVSLFVSNILFWSKEDYFAPAAEENPLLHTWSLAVEEQFYIFFPLMLLGLWRFGKKPAFYAVIVVSVLSLAAAELGWRSNPSANFYLLHSRAWELGVGAICAFLLINRSAFESQIMSLLGIILILFSILVYDESTPFPSVYTLPPVIGTALIILFGSKGTLIAKVLSSKAFVGVGLISFSAYLWHQPLLAFARIINPLPPSKYVMGGLALLSLVFAYGTWKYIETPFRERRVRFFDSKRIVLSSSLIAGAIFIVFGLYVHSTKGVIERFEGSDRVVLQDSIKYKSLMKEQAYDRYGCFFDQSQVPNVLIDSDCVSLSSEGRIILFGDSEAAHYLEGLKQSHFSNKVFQWTGASCRPIYLEDAKPRCKEFLNLFNGKILPNLNAEDKIIISANWLNTYNKIGEERFSLLFLEMLELFRGRGVQVYVIGNTPDFFKDPYAELIRLDKVLTQTVSLSVKDYRASDRIIKDLVETHGGEFLSPTEYLCDDNNPLECLFRRGGEYLFFDKGHLSYIGSISLIKSFSKRLFGESGS